MGHSACLNHDAEIVSLQREPERNAQVGSGAKPLYRVVAALRDLPARGLILELLGLVRRWHLQSDYPVLEGIEPINQIIQPKKVEQGSRDTYSNELLVLQPEWAVLLEPDKQHELACSKILQH